MDDPREATEPQDPPSSLAVGHLSATRSLNKSQSTPERATRSWLSKIGSWIAKSISSMDPSARDRAVRDHDSAARRRTPGPGLHMGTVQPSPQSRIEEDQEEEPPQDEEDREQLPCPHAPAQVVHVRPPAPASQRHLPLHPQPRSSDPSHVLPPAVSNTSRGMLSVLRTSFKQLLRGGSLDEEATTSRPAADPQRRASVHWSDNDMQLNQAQPEHSSVLATRLAAAQRTNVIVQGPDMPPEMERATWSLHDFHIHHCIHSGYASDIYAATCKISGQHVALKIYHADALPALSQRQLEREARLQATLSHRHIVQLHAAFRMDSGDEGAGGSNSRRVVLVLEHAGAGDLLSFVRQIVRMSERTASSVVIKPLVKALCYLHGHGIVHRDVKLENILFFGRSDPTAKLADFGLCLDLRHERGVTRVGTLDYMAPEVLRCPTKNHPEEHKERGDLQYGTPIDIWSLGIVAYEILNGVPPFSHFDVDKTERLICQGYRPPFTVDASEQARDFVYACLNPDPAQRATALQLLSHPWLTGAHPPIPVTSGTPSYRRETAWASPSRRRARLLARAGLLGVSHDGGGAPTSPHSMPHSGGSSTSGRHPHVERMRASMDVQPRRSEGAIDTRGVVNPGGGVVDARESDGDGRARGRGRLTLAERVRMQMRTQSASAPPRRGEVLPSTPPCVPTSPCVAASHAYPSSSTAADAQMADKDVYLDVTAKVEEEAAARRAGRLLHRQSAYHYRPGEVSSARETAARAAVAAVEAEQAMAAAVTTGRTTPQRSSFQLLLDVPRKPPRPRPELERRHSELSRHTTDAGYRSVTRSLRGSAHDSDGCHDDSDDEMRNDSWDGTTPVTNDDPAGVK